MLIAIHLAALGVLPSRKPLAALPDLPAWWAEVLFVCVLRPVLARGLPSWATGVTRVISRVS
jgi:hypothetical protein